MPKYLSFPEEIKLPTILHAIFGYFFLLLIVRVLSRRPGGQLTLFEFVIVFLIGGVIILSTVGKDRSVTNWVPRFSPSGSCTGWSPASKENIRAWALSSTVLRSPC